MTVKGIKREGIVMTLFIVFLVAQICVMTASADDAEQLKRLPGLWTCTDEVEREGEEPQEMSAALTLEEDGTMLLRCSGKGGGYLYTCEGTWQSEFVPDGMDRLTLRFTSTDNPLQEGHEYSVECIYSLYTESWVENDTNITALILEEASCSGVSPFEELFDYGNIALFREQGPNMRVVNCTNYVSLRSNRSTSSARLAKVPLGALVLAFPEAGEENGFIWCVYHDEYGYILSEYLQPVE